MKRLLCLIKPHKWLANQWPITLGAFRQCKRCGREEIVYYETSDGKVKWKEYQGLSYV